MSDLETEDLDSSINNGIVEGAYPVKLSRKTQVHTLYLILQNYLISLVIV